MDKKEFDGSKEIDNENLKYLNNRISVLELDLERKNIICNKYEELKNENEILCEKIKNMVIKEEMEYYKRLYLYYRL